MRIGMDITCAARRARTGIALYTIELLNSLIRQEPSSEYYLYCRPRNWRFLPQFEAGANTKLRMLPRLRLALALTASSLDIFHGTDLRLPRLNRHRPRLVATVHDVFSLVSDQFAPARFRQKKLRQYRHTAEAADAIIAVSQSTRADFLKFFPQAEPKTSVVYEGVDRRLWQPLSAEKLKSVLRDELQLPERYLLFVGNLTVRKNVVRIIEAFMDVLRKLGGDLFLVLVGRATYGSEKVMEAIKRADHPERLITLGYISHHQLPAIYQGAVALVFPTLYEGFGLPIVEAMASGCPVITSSHSANAEIAGDAAYLVEPYDVEAIASAIYNAVSDKALREELAVRGSQRARLFDWQTTASQTLEIYRNLLR